MVQKAIFIGIDGAQLEQLMLLGLEGKAQEILGLDIVEGYAGGVRGTTSQQSTSSGPGWSTLLTGTWVDQHGVSSNNNLPVASDVTSIFEYINNASPTATMASIVHWSPINTGHFAPEMGLLGDPAIVDHVSSGLSDQAVADTAVNLINTEAPDFTFVHLDDVDGAGHAAGFGETYDNALINASHRVGQILDAVAAREAAHPDEDWLVIVATDHGRDPETGSTHGGQTASERRIFIASNEDLASFADPVPQTSIVATILDHLDIPFTLTPDGLESGSLLEGAPDPIPPVLEAILAPADDAAGIAIDSNLSLRFSENIQKGAGDIIVKLASDDSVVATIDVTSNNVTISGDIATIDLPANLASETSYYVEIEPGAFTDGVNVFAGISDKTTWNFTTDADSTAPEIVALQPADGSVDVSPDSNLVLEFNETVLAGTGNILIKRVDDGSTVETIDVTSGQVTIDGNTVTIDPAGELEPGVEYYVAIDPGALRDTAQRTTIFSEDFEGLALQPFVGESGGDGTDFTAAPPAGWTHENTTPAGGPVEYYGWSFFDKNSWINSAGNQGRAGFTKGTGTVMVADPDEYDDGATDIDPNLFNAHMKTPAIDLTGIAAGTATLTFDSSWRREDNQKAVLTVSYDGGAPIELLRWTSDPSDPDFKADATDEAVTIALNNPVGASSAVISFGVIDGGNDWWWAIDNIAVEGTSNNGEATGNPFAGIDDPTAWNFTVQDDGTGDLVLVGTPQDDVLEGAAGNDQIQGLGADDVLSGGEGADVIEGGAGDDVLDGGAGNDALDGGENDDVLDSGEGDDVLKGGVGDDVLMGNAGIDNLAGGEGDDVLDGGDEADVLDGGAGTDELTGGAGDDAFLYRQGGFGTDTIADFQAGDKLDFDRSLFGDAEDVLDHAAQVGDDVVITLDGANAITLVGVTLGDLGEDSFAFTGEAPDQHLVGGSGADTLTGGAGDDLLEGGYGNDVLNGKAGNDVLDGGYGNDSLAGGSGDDNLKGGYGHDSLDGGSGDDSLDGGYGNDSLVAGAGDDALTGGYGNDTLAGGEGADGLDGGYGNDVLDGGVGNDLLTGGRGADTFVFAASFGEDTITDFGDCGADVIAFAGGLFASFADMMAHAAQAGSDVTITLDDDNTLTLIGTKLATLHEDDFSFV
ncbi:Ig-like domain-containing protein [Dongia sedimenti]|uniref:Ig-like domain-containing protein n=1 Tax=Dongia sedimenti TaxID=3064282 RepID=A0ABU0YPT9_9PROT|nr:Ig-like domain-containing protein [Rhodospirillaceae bacterium R-7]